MLIIFMIVWGVYWIWFKDYLKNLFCNKILIVVVIGLLVWLEGNVE